MAGWHHACEFACTTDLNRSRRTAGGVKKQGPPATGTGGGWWHLALCHKRARPCSESCAKPHQLSVYPELSQWICVHAWAGGASLEL